VETIPDAPIEAGPSKAPAPENIQSQLSSEHVIQITISPNDVVSALIRSGRRGMLIMTKAMTKTELAPEFQELFARIIAEFAISKFYLYNNQGEKLKLGIPAWESAAKSMAEIVKCEKEETYYTRQQLGVKATGLLLKVFPSVRLNIKKSSK